MTAVAGIATGRPRSSPLRRARDAAGDAAPPLIALAIALGLWEGTVAVLRLPL